MINGELVLLEMACKQGHGRNGQDRLIIRPPSQRSAYLRKAQSADQYF